jgi:tRNA U34 5-methylaminomethyl-2-thiouridine-forming methyltransferase MnmC
MKREIKLTSDGSRTIYLPELDETYHSNHGAFNEAMHIFIEQGIRTFSPEKTVRIFEMGFGTGLNSLLTLIESITRDYTIEYTGIEAFPVAMELVSELDYCTYLNWDSPEDFTQMHTLTWGEKHQITPAFSFQKIHQKIEDYQPELNHFELVYYDAFGPRVQGDLWQPMILEKMHTLLKPGGVLVTYCAQGQVKRDLKALGFEVVSLPGPPGKREMTKAIKI